MKHLKLIILLGLSSIYLSSCGGGSGQTVKNEFLGEIPSIEKNYSTKLQEKEKAIKECTDMDKAFKLDKETELLKEEWENKIQESLETNPLNKSLPFENLEDASFTVNEITVDNASKGNVTLKFSVNIDEDIKSEYGNLKKRLSVYFKALDKDGKDIEDSKTVAISFDREAMKAGKTITVSGTWQTKGLKNMENFAKVKIIPKEEYENK
jgi:hypothetical protein